MTQVIISGGIDLSSGSVVGATAMIAMSFGQTAIVNGKPNPKVIFPRAMDLPVIVPILVGLGCGLFAGLINGALIAYTKIPPFIATLGHDGVGARRGALVVEGPAGLVPDRGLRRHRQGQMPVFVFLVLAILFHLIMRYTLYGKRSYAIGSNEAAARDVGINVERHKVLVYTIAGVLAAVAASCSPRKNLTAQAGMGVMYELDAIAMAVIGGVRSRAGAARSSAPCSGR